jgi:hypothetical protein
MAPYRREFAQRRPRHLRGEPNNCRCKAPCLSSRDSWNEPREAPELNSHERGRT